jgi:hypothetical protein
VTLPNFLIIGAAKAGTTSLYEHFRAHPAIFMPRLKEPRFFCYGGAPGAADRLKFPIQSLEEYAALFAEAGAATALGEASVHYLRDPAAAGRIHATIPGARLIASLRDPVDRAFSVYQMNQRNREAAPTAPFADALRRDPALHYAYHDNLARYFDVFPRDQLRVILLEDLEGRPQRTLAGLFEFLGVDPDFTPDLDRVANPGGAPRIKALHSVLSNRRLIAASRRVMPEALVAPLKALRSRNLAKASLAADDRRMATAFFREDILRTQDLIGRDLSHWLRA